MKRIPKDTSVPEVVTVTPSRLKGCGFCLLSLIILGAGIIVTFGVQKYVVGVFNIVIGIFFAAYSLSLVLPNLTYLRLEPDHFEYRVFFVTRRVEWRDVDFVKVQTVQVRRATSESIEWSFKAQNRLDVDSRLEPGKASQSQSLPGIYDIPTKQLCDLMNKYLTYWNLLGSNRKEELDLRALARRDHI